MQHCCMERWLGCRGASGTERVRPKGFKIESFTFTWLLLMIGWEQREYTPKVSKLNISLSLLLDCADDDWDAWGWRQRLKGFEIESDFHNYSKLYPSDTILNQITIPKILEQWKYLLLTMQFVGPPAFLCVQDKSSLMMINYNQLFSAYFFKSNYLKPWKVFWGKLALPSGANNLKDFCNFAFFAILKNSNPLSPGTGEELMWVKRKFRQRKCQGREKTVVSASI